MGTSSLIVPARRECRLPCGTSRSDGPRMNFARARLILTNRADSWSIPARTAVYRARRAAAATTCWGGVSLVEAEEVRGRWGCIRITPTPSPGRCGGRHFLQPLQEPCQVVEERDGQTPTLQPGVVVVVVVSERAAKEKAWKRGELEGRLY
ncbi:hypothetical protein E2C01_013846 [Portunus trituberculatus]|uniref:Uncharacterized protein n=1 Tax=Portunus trituberculatus TaxID=210409 RepID=A0A5B7DI47_PORTR|nr:hypothetical protein [Portunus trituberculatus]